jgi:anti-anti-sigma factor
MSRYRHLGVRERDGVIVVSFGDQWILDHATVNAVRDELYSVATQPGCCHLLLNLAGVSFLSMEMLRKLPKLQRIMASKGGELKLCDVEPEALDVLAEARLSRTIDVHETETDALKTFGCVVATA